MRTDARMPSRSRTHRRIPAPCSHVIRASELASGSQRRLLTGWSRIPGLLAAGSFLASPSLSVRLIDPVQHLLPIDAIAKVSATAQAVQAEGGDGDDQVRFAAAEEHRAHRSRRNRCRRGRCRCPGSAGLKPSVWALFRLTSVDCAISRMRYETFGTAECSCVLSVRP